MRIEPLRRIAKFGLLFSVWLAPQQGFPETLRLDRSASSNRFVLQAGPLALAGSLSDYSAELSPSGGEAAGYRFSGRTNLQSAEVNGAEDNVISRLSLGKSVQNPEVRIDGVIAPEPKSSGMFFKGKVRRGKEVYNISMPVKMEHISNGDVLLSGKMSGALSALFEGLPFPVDEREGSGSAEARLRFVRMRAPR